MELLGLGDGYDPPGGDRPVQAGRHEAPIRGNHHQRVDTAVNNSGQRAADADRGQRRAVAIAAQAGNQAAVAIAAQAGNQAEDVVGKVEQL